jgi:OCT family organic cation transporter-like MFS transporter 13
VLVAAIEIPAYIALPLIIDVWGRKPLFVCTQLIPGIFCIIAAFLTPGTALYAILALTAKLGAAMAFNVTFMYTAQLYPTSIR